MFKVQLRGGAQLGMVVTRDYSALPLSGLRASFLRSSEETMVERSLFERRTSWGGSERQLQATLRRPGNNKTLRKTHVDFRFYLRVWSPVMRGDAAGGSES